MIKKIGTRTGKKIVCVKCGRNMSKLRPKIKKIGNLEYTYIKCRRCGAIFVANVTDPPLRESLAIYESVAASIVVAQNELKKLRADKTVAREIITAKEKALEVVIRDLQKRKDMCVKRSRELRERYPLNTKGVRL